MQIGDYIYDLAKRPRDVIAFFNNCILAGVDQHILTIKQLAVTEGEYSRLRAIADEWNTDYPSLLDFARVLNRRPSSFKLSAVTNCDIENLCLDIVAQNPEGSGILHENAKAVVDCILPAEDFKYTVFQIFYKVGLVGLKVAAHEGGILGR